MFTENICPACNPTQMVVFCKNVLILYNNESIFLFQVAFMIRILLVDPLLLLEGAKFTYGTTSTSYMHFSACLFLKTFSR